jgi:dienelactone hydrolase
MVAERLHEAGFATVLADLLTPVEEVADARTAQLRFDIGLLAGRLAGMLGWLDGQPATSGLPRGLFGASTGAAAALATAARRPADVRAVVSRGGRPDLAGAALAQVKAPTLLIVGGNDPAVVELNEQAAAALTAGVALHVVPGATHLFAERGALEEVAARAADWFTEHLR